MKKNHKKTWIILFCISISITIVMELMHENLLLTYSISKITDHTLPIQEKGNYTRLELDPYLFKEKVCPHLKPIEVVSDKVGNSKYDNFGSCIVYFKGKDLLLTKDIYPEIPESVFKALTEPYNKMGFQDRQRTIIEIQKPNHGWFILTPSEKAIAQIYLLASGNLNKNFVLEAHKFHLDDKLIYKFKVKNYEEWIIVLSKDSRYDCVGADCLEYLQRIKII